MPEPIVALSKHPAFVIPSVPALELVVVPVNCHVSFVTVVVTLVAVPVVRVPLAVVPSEAFSVNKVVSP